MYILGVTPWKSKDWHPELGEDLPNLDNTYLTPGARGVKKKQEARAPERMMREEALSEGDLQASGARV